MVWLLDEGRGPASRRRRGVAAAGMGEDRSVRRGVEFKARIIPSWRGAIRQARYGALARIVPSGVPRSRQCWCFPGVFFFLGKPARRCFPAGTPTPRVPPAVPRRPALGAGRGLRPVPARPAFSARSLTPLRVPSLRKTLHLRSSRCSFRVSFASGFRCSPGGGRRAAARSAAGFAVGSRVPPASRPAPATPTPSRGVPLGSSRGRLMRSAARANAHAR